MDDQARLTNYSASLRIELANILDYWTKYAVDDVHGGFVGSITESNQVDRSEDKGVMLNAQLLWAFSAAFNAKASEDLTLADRAYHYLADYFVDKDYGGVYWTVDYLGQPKDTKKQIYAIAFTIHALSEYFMASGLVLAKEHAVALYRDLVKYSHDHLNGGYLEVFSRGWADLNELSVGDKGANVKKTLNTQLFVLEAYTKLYTVWPDEDLKLLLQELIHDFKGCVVNSETKHLDLFFDEYWVSQSAAISYGQDIEASWLLQEGAELTEDESLINEVNALSLQLAEVSLEGIDENGALRCDQDQEGHQGNNKKCCWVQAEAMVGFFNAWQHTGSEKFLRASINHWEYVQAQRWGKLQSEWKNPYHLSRACMELIRRILLFLFFLLPVSLGFAQEGPIDALATRETKALYKNLYQLSKKHTLFGHQHATEYGRGWSGQPNRSDVKSVVGSHPAVIGVDFSGLSGRPSAEIERTKVSLRRNIMATYKRGGVNTVAWHFSNPISGGGFYWKDSLSLPAVKYLIPGGKNHEDYKVILDGIASFAKSLTGENGELIPLIFRPYHEFDGDWFWWGKPYCTREEFIDLWRFTVSYLRDQRGVHNFIYAFSPDNNFNSAEEFLERYPGDEWVDMVGMDNYADLGRNGHYALDAAVRKLTIVSAYATEKRKLAALTETGLESLVNPNWWTSVLLKVMKRDEINMAYVLVWRNDPKSPTHYYAPYPGHPHVADFIRFFNDPYTLFEKDLKNIYD